MVYFNVGMYVHNILHLYNKSYTRGYFPCDVLSESDGSNMWGKIIIIEHVKTQNLIRNWGKWCRRHKSANMVLLLECYTWILMCALVKLGVTIVIIHKYCVFGERLNTSVNNFYVQKQCTVNTHTWGLFNRKKFWV